jgi:copper resistance protein D
MITVYAIHVLATAAWVGGLTPLLFALIEQRHFGPHEARDRTLDICSRFSLMAMVVVTLVVASGIANAGFRVEGSFLKLFDSDYGDVLLKKIAIVAAMLALAYFNRFIAMPRLRAASPKGMTRSPGFAIASPLMLGSARSSLARRHSRNHYAADVNAKPAAAR